MIKSIPKLFLVFLILLAASAPPVFAHLSGVFAYFVQDMDEPSAGTRLLQQQLDSVGERITRLEPEVEQARAEYYNQADTAVRRMRFYDVYAGSAIGALWAGAQDPIDVLASTELMQKTLERRSGVTYRTIRILRAITRQGGFLKTLCLFT